MSTSRKWKVRFAAIAVLPAFAISGPGFAQQSPLEYQEQQAALRTFYIRFVAPLDACAAADPQSLEKARGLVDAARQKYSRTFQVVEKHPVYVTALRAGRAETDRSRASGKGATAVQACSRGIAALEDPNAQKQYDRYMKYLLDLLS